MLLKMIISHYYKVSKYRQLRYICLTTGGVRERERKKERKPEGVSNSERDRKLAQTKMRTKHRGWTWMSVYIL